MIHGLAIECDELEIRAVLKRDQRVVAADRVLAAGNDGEAELFIVFRRLSQIIDDDDEVIDSLNHAR